MDIDHGRRLSGIAGTDQIGMKGPDILCSIALIGLIQQKDVRMNHGIKIGSRIRAGYQLIVKNIVKINDILIRQQCFLYRVVGLLIKGFQSGKRLKTVADAR